MNVQQKVLQLLVLATFWQRLCW